MEQGTVPGLAFKVGGGEKDKQRGSVDRARVAPAPFALLPGSLFPQTLDGLSVPAVQSVS
jgi:hypothetical protein